MKKHNKQERDFVICQAKKVGFFMLGIVLACLISYLILKW